jgi:hypothetical protein
LMALVLLGVAVPLTRDPRAIGLLADLRGHQPYLYVEFEHNEPVSKWVPGLPFP